MLRRKPSTFKTQGANETTVSYRLAGIAPSSPQERSIDEDIEANHQHCQKVLPIHRQSFLVDDWHKIMRNKVPAITRNASAHGEEILECG